jgi:DNA-binding phage protein
MNNIAGILREMIKREKVSIYRVAKGIGVDFSSLYRALKDEGNVGAKTINKILDHLGYEIRFVKPKRKEAKPKSKPSRLRRN